MAMPVACKCCSMSEIAALTVVHRDADLLVLHKPSGLPTTSPDGSGCLASMARALDPAAPRMHASSRLDAEVTGLVTFARTDRAIASLMAARQAGTYQRFYLALASRAPEPAEGEWHWAIAKDPRNPRRRVARPDGAAGAVTAHSRYRVLRVQPSAALLLMRPETGRTHQLRVHASEAGAPLLGDKHYGGPMRVVLADGGVLRAARVMLHCARLQLPGIANAEPLTLDAQVPDDMRGLFVQLGGDARDLLAQTWAPASAE
jgi:23S rRNA-/tRNA-specific pseudouridylate synthase